MFSVSLCIVPDKLFKILRCLYSMEYWKRRRDSSVPEQHGQQANELAHLFGQVPWRGQTFCSVSASQQYCLPVLLAVTHYKLLIFGRDLDLFVESCSGQKKDESIFCLYWVFYWFWFGVLGLVFFLIPFYFFKFSQLSLSPYFDSYFKQQHLGTHYFCQQSIWPSSLAASLLKGNVGCIDPSFQDLFYF